MIAFCWTIKKYTQAGLLTTMTFLPIFTNSNYQVLWANIIIGGEASDIKFNKGYLSVKLKNAPLEEVLKEIMLQSGARIWLNESIDMSVTIEFQNIPIGEGVRKILKDKNYAFVYTQNEMKEGKLSIINTSKSQEVFTKSKEEFSKKLSQKPIESTVKKDKIKNEKPSLETLAKDALENEDAEKRENAIVALGESKDKKAIEIISKVLANDSSKDVRLSSVDALLEIGDKSIVESLSVALKDREPEVRESTIEALGEVGGEAAIAFIKSAINDEDSSVRELAQETLEELNTKK